MSSPMMGLPELRREAREAKQTVAARSFAKSLTERPKRRPRKVADIQGEKETWH